MRLYSWLPSALPDFGRNTHQFEGLECVDLGDPVELMVPLDCMMFSVGVVPGFVALPVIDIDMDTGRYVDHVLVM